MNSGVGSRVDVDVDAIFEFEVAGFSRLYALAGGSSKSSGVENRVSSNMRS